MKNVKSVIYISLLVFAVSSSAFGKQGTISTTKAGTISTTRGGTISTTAARTGTISTTRAGIVSTTRYSVPARVDSFSLYELLIAAFRLW